MTNRRSSPRGRTPARRGTRPRYGWTQATVTEALLAAGAQTVVDLLGGFTVGEKRAIQSIIRIIGHFYYKSQSVNADVHGRWGIHQVTDDAMAALAVPDPLGDFESGWMINTDFSWDRAASEYVREDVDIKSRRRLAGGLNTIAYVLDNSAASNASVQFSFGFRILYIRA